MKLVTNLLGSPITVHWLRIKVAIIYTPCCKLACFICFIEVPEFGFRESE